MAPILVQPFGTLWSPTTKPPTYVFEEHPYSERVPLSIPAGAAFLATLEPVDAAARCAPIEREIRGAVKEILVVDKGRAEIRNLTPHTKST